MTTARVPPNPSATPRAQTSPGSPSVLSVGTFDGVHVGHGALIARARQIAREHPGSRVVALVFDPNPLEVLRPDAAPARLTSFEHRGRWLREAGADEVIRLEPTQELLSETPEKFVQTCVERFRPIAFVEGDDFRFGRGRAGDVAALADLGKRHAFSVDVVPTTSVSLTDHQIVAARSTIVRWLLSEGRMSDATRVLGRPYELTGAVVQGDRRGRTIGFPTANVQVGTLIPADGVYAAIAELPDGRAFPAAVSVGTKPTFGEHARAVEAFILQPGRSAGGSGAWRPIDGLPEYGWTLTLRMLSWVRDQVRFGSLPELLDQMERDCRRCHEIAAPAVAVSSSRGIRHGKEVLV